MFQMVFLQFLYDLSDREVEEQITYDMAFKWFLGLSAEEFPPDHTTLCRFRQRLGAEGFRTLFNQVVEQARTKGFVSDRLHILDAPHLEAKVDLFRIKKEHANQHDDDDHIYIDRGSPDPEARFGRKSNKRLRLIKPMTANATMPIWPRREYLLESRADKNVQGVLAIPGKSGQN